ncbi:MAG TPA: O-methyltransferase [Anaerolineales bacterium]|nr:O-methyltransferase [Anaerolineales bacterium]
MPIYNDEISRFINDHFAAEDDGLRRARVESQERGLPAISVRAEEGRFLMVLATAAGAGKAVEIGTLGGYSGMWIARGLKPGGKLITIDLNSHHTDVARDHIERAGLSGKVEFLTGEGLETLAGIVDRGPFDFVFIDADKTGYPDYYEWAVANLRPGGTICAHNAFRGGRILDADPEDEIRRFVQFLERVAGDDRVVSTIYPAGDGTLVAVKKVS